MARYLLQPYLESALRRGQEVECFLGGGVVEGRSTIRWVSLHADHGAIVASRVEAYDPRDPEFLDIYAFEFVGRHGDEPVEVCRFVSVAEALDHASRAWGADPSRFTNHGVAQDEYADFLSALGGRNARRSDG